MLKSFLTNELKSRTHLKNTSARDMSQFSQGHEARMKTYPLVRRVRNDKCIAEIGHIPRGLRQFFRPDALCLGRSAIKHTFLGKPCGTKKLPATRAGDILEMGSRANELYSRRRGMTLVEVLVAIGVGIGLIIAAAAPIAPALKVNTTADTAKIAGSPLIKLSANI